MLAHETGEHETPGPGEAARLWHSSFGCKSVEVPSAKSRAACLWASGPPSPLAFGIPARSSAQAIFRSAPESKLARAPLPPTTSWGTARNSCSAFAFLSLSSPPLHTHPAKARPPARCSTPAPQRIARALSVCRRAACAPAHPHHPATEISAWPYRSRWRTAWLHQFSENRIRQAQSPRWTARRSQRPGTQSGLVVKLVRLFAWCLQLCLCSPSALRRQPPSRQPPGIARGRCWLSLPRPSAARGPP